MAYDSITVKCIYRHIYKIQLKSFMTWLSNFKEVVNIFSFGFVFIPFIPHIMTLTEENISFDFCFAYFWPLVLKTTQVPRFPKPIWLLYCGFIKCYKGWSHIDPRSLATWDVGSNINIDVIQTHEHKTSILSLFLNTSYED